MQSNLSISNFSVIVKRMISFSLLFGVIVYIFSGFFRIVQYPRDSLYDFYNYMNQDTIDVLCVGSSHVYCSINPVQMYDDYGIAAYDLAAGGQAIWCSYYYILEALKNQKPRVVILDVFTVRVEDDYYFDYKNVQTNLLNMKPSYSKWKALQAAEIDRGGVELLLGFPITHSRYKQLRSSSFNLEDNYISYLGYSYQPKIVPYEVEEIRDVRGVTEITPITRKAEEYLRKSIELCQEQGVSIILVNAPMPTTPEEAQMKYNYVQQIADEYEIPFLNGVCYDEEMGLDWGMDSMGNDGHLNYKGATKYTKWLCDYLESNYELPDRRDDSRYARWKYESDKFKAVLRRDSFKRMKDIMEFLDNLQSEDLYYVLSLNGKYNTEDGKVVLDALAAHGVDIKKNGTYVMKGKTKLFYLDEEAKHGYWKYFDDSVLYVYGQDSNHVILWNKVDNATVKNGVNIFIYDELLDEVVRKFGYDAEQGYEWVE